VVQEPPIHGPLLEFNRQENTKPNRVLRRVYVSPVAIGFLASGALQPIPRILDPSVGIIRRRHRAFKPLRIHDPITHVRCAEPELAARRHADSL
jgi:hypothetical protein